MNNVARLESTKTKISHLDIAKGAINAQANALKALADRLELEFCKAVEMILACEGRVVVCGMGKSGLVGRKMVATLASTGTPSFFMHPGEAFHGDLGMLKPIDVVVLISYSGETEEVIRLIPSLKSFDIPFIAMTAKKSSTIGKHAEVWLDVSVEREVCPNNLAPTTSTLAAMAVGDALAVSLIQARDFKPLDFAKFHPGGSLGRRLLARVGDVMHTNLPSVTPDTVFHGCLFTMTSGRLGIALVMDGEELVGIVTDGDLRRAMLKNDNAASLTAKSLMTSGPLTTKVDTMYSDAVDLMHQHKVKALIVTDDAGTKPRGIVEIFN